MNYLKISFLEALVKSWFFLKYLGLLCEWHYFAGTFYCKNKCYAAVFCQWSTCSSEQNIKLWSVSMKQGKSCDYENRKPPLLVWMHPAYSFQSVSCEQRREKSGMRDLTGPFPKGGSYWLYFFMQLSSFCMLNVVRKSTPGMISQPCWLLEQISDFRITKTECKLGRLTHDCIC